MSVQARFDRPLLFITILLIGVGFMIFSSASLSLLARESSNYSSVAFSQTVLGLLLGTVAMVGASRLNFKIWRKYAFFILLGALILNLLLLIPGFGLTHGGATRWLDLGPVSFQPAEFLKIGFIIYLSAWLASVKDGVKTFRYGLLPFFIALGLSAVVLMLQRDTGSLMIIIFSGTAVLFAAGARWKHVLIILLIAVLGLFALMEVRPYVKQRLMTFINPAADATGAGWQVQQSLIAIGSGGVFGAGFGQSVQKFTYLPEPTSDSIFAVVGEEFGFVGSVFIVFLFAIFALRGIKVASDSKDIFGRLLIVGIVIMIVSQAFVNIGAMLGVVPLSGITLPFVSHGGTSLFFTLFSVGIVLSASKTRES